MKATRSDSGNVVARRIAFGRELLAEPEQAVLDREPTGAMLVQVGNLPCLQRPLQQLLALAQLLQGELNPLADIIGRIGSSPIRSLIAFASSVSVVSRFSCSAASFFTFISCASTSPLPFLDRAMRKSQSATKRSVGVFASSTARCALTRSASACSVSRASVAPKYLAVARELPVELRESLFGQIAFRGQHALQVRCHRQLGIELLHLLLRDDGVEAGIFDLDLERALLDLVGWIQLPSTPAWLRRFRASSLRCRASSMSFGNSTSKRCCCSAWADSLAARSLRASLKELFEGVISRLVQLRCRLSAVAALEKSFRCRFGGDAYGPAARTESAPTFARIAHRLHFIEQRQATLERRQHATFGAPLVSTRGYLVDFRFCRSPNLLGNLHIVYVERRCSVTGLALGRYDWHWRQHRNQQQRHDDTKTGAGGNLKGEFINNLMVLIFQTLVRHP